MALTGLQQVVCQLLAQSRIESGESYVAGGVALNTVLERSRISRDLDLFHDTETALQVSADRDRALLEASGFALQLVRERPGFVQAIAQREDASVTIEWVRDSAYRFFPLMTHPLFGLTLHPFDLATNKVLALVGRVEVRDWIDTISCTEAVQPLGYLAWAACGKDPGYSPLGIVEAAARTARYSRAEVEALAFEGPPPDAGLLSQRWHRAVDEARALLSELPVEQAGKAVLRAGGELYRGDLAALVSDLRAGTLAFHEGSIRGAFPTVR